MILFYKKSYTCIYRDVKKIKISLAIKRIYREYTETEQSQTRKGWFSELANYRNASLPWA